MISITVNGVAYSVPSSAADTDWAAAQVAFQQALAAALPSYGPAVQRLYSSGVAVGNTADNNEDNLKSYNLPGATLAAGRALRIIAWGDGLQTNDTTTLRAYLGGTKVLEKVLTVSQQNMWRAVLELSSIDGVNATASALLAQSNAATQTVNIHYLNELPTFGFDVSAAQLLRFTGQRSANNTANSVVCRAMSVELIP